MAISRATEPLGGGPIDRPHIQIAAVADDPDRHGVAQRVIGSERGDAQLLAGVDPVELVARPAWGVSDVMTHGPTNCDTDWRELRDPSAQP